MISLALLIVVMTLNLYKTQPTVTVSKNTSNATYEEATKATATEPNKVNENKTNQNMKGLWVTYMDLDMSDTDRSYSSFKNKFNKITDDALKYGFNTLIVQVRPFSDALYKSSYFPASHILSGQQGKYCNYDALKYMCERCHKKGLNIHAWINPYRISSNKTPAELSSDNPYIKDKSLGVKTDDGIFYNPALKKVQDLIVNGVKEIAENYPVDGIQFDDYFYPTKDKSFDSKEYKAYVKAQKSHYKTLSKWRENNVNKLIKACYKAVHNTKKDIVFGVSPQGNIENNYEIYADVKTWCSSEGYIDYICPQLYYSLDNPALTYEKAIADWKKIKTNKNILIYSGLAGYKAGSDSDNGTWEDFNDILKSEYEIALSKKYNGAMLYSYSSLKEKSAKKELNNLKKALIGS
jgi:uncharacterized lipoprotein YddW (UPF0748 family)